MRLNFLFVMVFSLVLLSYAAYAQEQCAGRATQGSVSMDTPGHCDVFSRQLEYRKNAAAFRKALIDRQEKYGAGLDSIKRTYSDSLDNTFRRESAEYMKQVERENEASKGDEKAEKADDGKKITLQDADDLKEKIVVIDADGTQKRVIVPKDAPDF